MGRKLAVTAFAVVGVTILFVSRDHLAAIARRIAGARRLLSRRRAVDDPRACARTLERWEYEGGLVLP